jgi:hypothetical protein
LQDAAAQMIDDIFDDAAAARRRVCELGSRFSISEMIVKRRHAAVGAYQAPIRLTTFLPYNIVLQN